MRRLCSATCWEVKYLAKALIQDKDSTHMFQPEPGISDLISKYIQFPQDPLLQEQVAAFCAAGPDQAAYVESRLTAWLLEEGAPAPAAAKPTRPLKKIKRKWIAAAAAALLLMTLLAWRQCHREVKQEGNHPRQKKILTSQSPPAWKTGRLSFRKSAHAYRQLFQYAF